MVPGFSLLMLDYGGSNNNGNVHGLRDQESTRRQSALKPRALSLGWRGEAREISDSARVFNTFLQRKSASPVLCFFHDHPLLLPRRDRFGDLVGKKPGVAAVLSLLKNPAYAGAWV